MRMITCLLMALSLTQSFFAGEKLPEKYLVAYGDPEAPVKIVEYYSFKCPHCISLFKRDFKKITQAFIETKKVYWVFHPVPADLVTIQGMICMANLDDTFKKLFLETILEEAESYSPQATALIMSKLMEIFKKPLPSLQEDDFIENTDAFMDAFNFLKNEETISAVPTVEVNAKLYPKDVPDFEFVNEIIK